jgi:hypothetical protein
MRRSQMLASVLLKSGANNRRQTRLLPVSQLAQGLQDSFVAEYGGSFHSYT